MAYSLLRYASSWQLKTTSSIPLSKTQAKMRFLRGLGGDLGALICHISKTSTTWRTWKTWAFLRYLGLMRANLASYPSDFFFTGYHRAWPRRSRGWSSWFTDPDKSEPQGQPTL